MRADRLKINNENIMFLGETDIDVVNQAIMDMNPKLVIIDSIQTMYAEDLTAAPRKCESSKRDYFASNESLQVKSNHNHYYWSCDKGRKYCGTKGFRTYGGYGFVFRRRKIFFVSNFKRS